MNRGFFYNYFVLKIYGDSFIYTFLCTVTCIVFLLNELPDKNIKSWVYKVIEMFLSTLFLILLCEIANLFLVDVDTMVMMMIYSFLYAFLRSKYKISSRLVLTTVFIASIQQIIIFSQTFTLFWQRVLNFRTEYLYNIDITSAVVIGFSILLVVFLKKFSTEKFNNIYVPFTLLLIIISFLGCFLFYIEKMEEELFEILMPISFSLWVINILAYLMFYFNSKEYNNRLDWETLKLKKEAETAQFLIIKENQMELRKLKHEISNYFSYANTLLKQKDYHNLSNFLISLDSDFKKIFTVSDCGNIVVDSVINSKSIKAKKYNIAMHCKISIPKNIGVKGAKLYSLLSNLLDNAIEAVIYDKIENPVIIITLKKEKAYLYFKITNPLNPNLRNRRLKLETSKKDKKNHGYGTHIINDIIKKFNGCIKYNIEDNLFISEGMIAVE